MPRKVNHGVDFDDYDGYYDVDDAYGDDDDDYDYRVEGNGKAAQSTSREVKKPGVWQCHICTYDNEEGMSSCDICGVLRYPLVSSSDSKKSGVPILKDFSACCKFIHRVDLFHAVGGICKDSGASVMAKSLFASLPQQRTEKPVIFKKQIGMEEGSNFLRPGKTHATFKFDSPSPDDLVSTGLRSSKVSSKANSVKLASVVVPSSISEVEVTSGVSSGAKRTIGSSASKMKGRNDGGDDGSSSVDVEKSQSLSNSLNNISLNDKSGTSKDVNIGPDPVRTIAREQYKPEKWVVSDQGEDERTQLNLAIVGHVDSGKSTLSGRLLQLRGRLSQKQVHKNEKEAKSQGKGSFAYAWAMDESAEERERGITMTVAVAYFDSNRYHVVLLDAPGHKDFVPNMISGATQADAAILVIDASTGSFEVGMDSSGGQSREHARLIRSFGVDQIIVVVNKLDVVGYSKERFDLIKTQVGTFLRSCGFRDASIFWIPLSAIENQNLATTASDARFLSWYKGPHLLDAIDSLQPPTRDFTKPLLMPICDIIKSASSGQMAACGKLESGALRGGTKVLVMPSGDAGSVRSLECNSQTCSVARAGDNVYVYLQGVDWNRVMAGDVLCHPDFPVSVATHLELKILVLDVAMPILRGYQLEFYIHHAKQAARVERLVSLLDPKTGHVIKKSPRCLLAKQSAVIEVVLDGAVCVEEFSKCRTLGRVFLRSSGKTISVGIVTRIINESKS